MHMGARGAVAKPRRQTSGPDPFKYFPNEFQSFPNLEIENRCLSVFQKYSKFS
jgi:hypothetical protein